MKKLKLLFKVFSVLTLILNLSTPVYAAAGELCRSVCHYRAMTLPREVTAF